MGQDYCGAIGCDIHMCRQLTQEHRENGPNLHFENKLDSFGSKRRCFLLFRWVWAKQWEAKMLLIEHRKCTN